MPRHPKEKIFKIMSMVEEGKPRKAIIHAVQLPAETIDYYTAKTRKLMKLARKAVDKTLQGKLPF